jgi:4-hydroxyphenylpyruvate dioxygenase
MTAPHRLKAGRLAVNDLAIHRLCRPCRVKIPGVKILPIPENYYEDLQARTDLTAERIQELQAHNILYDREGNAEYLQVYTQTFDERFFFEIVERRGYKGFGAVNAQIRLAAQARLARHPAIPRA